MCEVQPHSWALTTHPGGQALSISGGACELGPSVLMGAGRRGVPQGQPGPVPQHTLQFGASGALKLCRQKAGLTALTFLLETAKLTMAEGMH